MTKELKEDPMKLGIGQTTNGGSEGMAVLEGFISLIEVRRNLAHDIDILSIKMIDV